MKAILLAPGPSMSPELANFWIRPQQSKDVLIGVVNNCFELAPWADFLVANDMGWWDRHPDAAKFEGRRFTTNMVLYTERLEGHGMNTALNSGVVALEAAKRLGCDEIELHGFDMQGTHYFGKYTNGCGNTPDDMRERHQKQYEQWRQQNPSVVVTNKTCDSRLRAYPYEGMA